MCPVKFLNLNFISFVYIIYSKYVINENNEVILFYKEGKILIGVQALPFFILICCSNSLTPKLRVSLSLSPGPSFSICTMKAQALLILVQPFDPSL